MAYCKRCNRTLKKGERKRDHICDMVIIQKQTSEYDENGNPVGGQMLHVHTSRVEPGGDLRKDVIAGGDWKVVYRYRNKVERAADKAKKKAKKAAPAMGLTTGGDK